MKRNPPRGRVVNNYDDVHCGGHFRSAVIYTLNGGFCLRISGALFLTILFAVGYMLYLAGRDATSSLDAVAAVATDLREAGVTGRTLDRDLALQLIGAMESLLDTPNTLPDHIADLKTIAATAAAWADAAPSPSPELRAAVAIRKAAGELRAQATRPSTAHLMRARRYLEVASDAIQYARYRIGRPRPGSRHRCCPRSARQSPAITTGALSGARRRAQPTIALRAY